MFDFLNKLSHNHNQDPPEQQQVAFDEISSSEDEQLDGRALAFEERGNKDANQKSRLIASIKKIEREEKKEKKIERGQSIVGKMQIKEKLQLHPNALAILRQDKLASEKGSSSYLLDKVNLLKVSFVKQLPDVREKSIFERWPEIKINICNKHKNASE